MSTRNRRLARTGIALVAAATPMLAVAAPTFARQPTTVKTVITGLNAPRGLTFDQQGNLYVAESGIAGSGEAGLTDTGRVDKYRHGSNQLVWSTGFESLFVTEDPSQPPDVLGPAGLTTAGACNAGDDHHDTPDAASRHGRDGCRIEVILSESHDGIAAVSNGGIQTHDAGHLFALDPASGARTDVANVGDQQYQFTADHVELFQPDFPDSNPYGVLATQGRDSHRVRSFVADAGANTISEVMADGTTRVIAYIPNETEAPFRDATPTCIARGPDGMLYVATLHLVAGFSGPGHSDVWRVDPNANFPTVPAVWATGLTTATACTFDSAGNFWATEMFHANANGSVGDVVRIPFRHPDRLTRVGDDGSLPLPGGIAQGRDGAIYATINSASPVPGSGAVVKIRSAG